MFAEVIRQRLPGLPQEKIDFLKDHYELLLRWNQSLNLTRIKDLEAVVERHYCESIFLANH